MNPLKLPKIGMGTYQLTAPKCKPAVLKALELGYRLIDTAQIYGNEQDVGDAMSESTVSRKDIILATKVWITNYNGNVYSSTMESLKKLKTDYIDLLYLHWPGFFYTEGKARKVFIELNKLQDEGKVKHIGVSNFSIALIKQAMSLSKYPITANQIETHPLLRQPNMYNFLKENDIIYVAYSPLARGNLADIPQLKALAEKYKITTTQLALAWEIAKGIVPIPKASSEGHLKENFEAQNIVLSPEDVSTIDNLPIKKRMFNPPMIKAKWDD
jgi:2,5-diketo-D-gluconate reductase B